MNIQSIEDVQEAIREIEDCARDDEVAHSKEDALHRAVLSCIARNSPNSFAGILCQEALKTTNIEFARWYA